MGFGRNGNKPKRKYVKPTKRQNRPVLEPFLHRQVKPSGDSGHVYVPPALIGKWVKIIPLTAKELKDLGLENSK